MASISTWIQAFRLRTLPLSLAGILMGSAAAYHHECWDWRIFTLAMVTTVLFQILSNLANDYGDGVKGTDNASRIGPQRTVQSGFIRPKAMRNAIVLFSFLSLGCAGVLIYFGARDMPESIIWMYAGLALFSVLAAITYTVGKRAYGYHGLGDLMVFLFFGLVSVLGVFSLYAKAFLNENILLAACVGLLSTAVLNLNNMRDYQNDREAKKQTLVVKMGPNFAKFYHSLLVLLALVSLATYLVRTDEPIFLICGVPAAVLFIHLRKVMSTTNPKEFDPQLKVVALSTFALSICVWAGFIFLRYQS